MALYAEPKGWDQQTDFMRRGSEMGWPMLFIVKWDLDSGPVKFCETGVSKDIDSEGLASGSKYIIVVFVYVVMELIGYSRTNASDRETSS